MFVLVEFLYVLGFDNFENFFLIGEGYFWKLSCLILLSGKY